MVTPTDIGAHMEALLARARELQQELSAIFAEFEDARVACAGMLALQRLSVRLSAGIPQPRVLLDGPVDPVAVMASMLPPVAPAEPDIFDDVTEAVPVEIPPVVAEPAEPGDGQRLVVPVSELSAYDAARQRRPGRTNHQLGGRHITPEQRAIVTRRREEILAVIRTQGPITTTGVMRETGLGIKTVCNDVQTLRRNGVIRLCPTGGYELVDAVPTAPPVTTPASTTGWRADSKCENCGAAFKVDVGHSGRFCTRACYEGLDAVEVLRDRIKNYLRQAGPQRPGTVAVAMGITVRDAEEYLAFFALTGEIKTRPAA